MNFCMAVRNASRLKIATPMITSTATSEIAY
jgi:hypothetical protein